MASVDFDNLFKQFWQIKVAVVGDVMLDTYWWGNVERISPEAPVPTIALIRVGDSMVKLLAGTPPNFTPVTLARFKP